jgi:enterochelin esterase family protein
VRRTRDILTGLVLLAWAGCAAAQPSEIRRSEHFMSAALGREGSYDLYLPPDHDGLRGLPVIYLLHGVQSRGDDWLDQGNLQATADGLIAAGKMPRAIIVMPDAGDSWYVDAPVPAGMGAMGTALMRDLPDWIEAHYPASRERDGRAVAGYSMGGFGALRFVLVEPDRWVAAAAMSSALWAFLKPDTPVTARLAKSTARIFAGAFGNPFEPSRFAAESPLSLARSFPADAPRPAVLLISGRHEMFDAATEQDQARAALASAGIAVTVELTDGDHDWDNWKGMLPRVLSFLGASLKPPVPATTARR